MINNLDPIAPLIVKDVSPLLELNAHAVVAQVRITVKEGIFDEQLPLVFERQSELLFAAQASVTLVQL